MEPYNINAVKKLFIDIETGKADNYKDFEPEYKEPRKNKDGTANKTDRSIETQRHEWESKLALTPLTGKILCCGIINDEYPEGLVITGDGIEENVLNAVYYSIMNADIIVGHNIKEFDLWFLVNRFRAYGIPVPAGLYNRYKGRTYWSENIWDTMELWGMGKHKEMISLNSLCKFFGLEGKDDKISKNFEQVWNEERETAIEHCRRDVELAKQVYEKLTCVEELV